MAKGKKTGGRDFKPGCSGRPPTPPGLRESRRLNLSEFNETASKYRNMNVEMLKLAKNDPFISIWELGMINWLIEGAKDSRAYNTFNERFIGKVPDQVQMNGTLAQYKAPDGETTHFTIEENEEGE